MVAISVCELHSLGRSDLLLVLSQWPQIAKDFVTLGTAMAVDRASTPKALVEKVRKDLAEVVSRRDKVGCAPIFCCRACTTEALCAAPGLLRDHSMNH